VGHPELHFSLTRTERVVGVATGPTDVGLDAEMRRPVDDLRDVVLSVRERARGPAEDVLVAWTRKEALLKATGHGLGLPMDGVTLGGGPDPEVQVWPDDALLPHRLWLRDLAPAPDVAAAVAGVRGQVEPIVRELDGLDVLAALPADTHSPRRAGGVTASGASPRR
jgi:4'-phosphopantetheinyl transferase